jgi:hypothetical protein
MAQPGLAASFDARTRGFEEYNLSDFLKEFTISRQAHFLGALKYGR